ncbi:MAG: c-type cytochrome, partial [Pseudomonadales bacterium]|nr:c-type cytochrome [Pseudomonadales bacterium]
MKKKLVMGLFLIFGMSGWVQAQGNAAAGEGKIAVCMACHGASGNDSLLPNVPKIGGQSERYLLKQMQEIKSGVRAVPLMAGMLNNLNDQDLADCAKALQEMLRRLYRLLEDPPYNFILHTSPPIHSRVGKPDYWETIVR